MINNFSVFCLYMYVLVDDVMAQIRLLLKRRSSEPQCSDSELITISPGTRLKRRLGGTWSTFRQGFVQKSDHFRLQAALLGNTAERDVRNVQWDIAEKQRFGTMGAVSRLWIA